MITSTYFMYALNSNRSRINQLPAILIISGEYPSTSPHNPLGGRVGPDLPGTIQTPWIVPGPQPESLYRSLGLCNVVLK